MCMHTLDTTWVESLSFTNFLIEQQLPHACSVIKSFQIRKCMEQLYSYPRLPKICTSTSADCKYCIIFRLNINLLSTNSILFNIQNALSGSWYIPQSFWFCQHSPDTLPWVCLPPLAVEYQGIPSLLHELGDSCHLISEEGSREDTKWIRTHEKPYFTYSTYRN